MSSCFTCDVILFHLSVSEGNSFQLEPCHFVFTCSMAENFGSTRRDATSLSPEDPLWKDLEDSGFTKTGQLQTEFSRPHLVTFLFDDERECLEVVKGLHGPNYVLHVAMADSDRLFKWAAKHARRFEVDKREDRKSALRYKVAKPEKTPMADVYEELLGMDIKLQARVSKANYRAQVRFPSSSKADIEQAAREYWLTVMVGYLEEAALPIVAVAKATSNPADIMRRAFGTRRMKTLRNRARAWSRAREWMIMFTGDPYPRDVADMLEYLLFLVQEEAPKGRIQDVVSALAVLEDAGQVSTDMRISGTPVWVQGVKSRLAELELGRTQVRRAPPPTVGMLVALELTVMSVEMGEYHRAIAWVVLLCVWACLRLSDLEGLDPGRLTLGSRGLRGVLVRTKTTGPGKPVKETPIFVSRRISLTGCDWLRCGFDLWDGFGFKSRDYFVMASDSYLEAPKAKYATVERVGIYIRQVFLALQTPVKPRFQSWKLKDGAGMVDPIGMTYWSGHSMRHFLPTVAAAINISKEQRDYVGRWHINLHQSADYVHTSRQMVHQVQESVNRAICEGNPSYDESELVEDFACYLVTKGRSPDEWLKPHAVWKQVDGKFMIGGKWPTLGEDVYESEIWAQQSDQVAEATMEEQPADTVANEEMEQPKAAFFVTVSRHSGFRRLHKIGCCGLHPWTCYKVEYLARVTADSADAVCKTCQRATGKLVDDDGSSSSGSSSSTELEDNEPKGDDNEVPMDEPSFPFDS